MWVTRKVYGWTGAPTTELAMCVGRVRVREELVEPGPGDLGGAGGQLRLECRSVLDIDLDGRLVAPLRARRLQGAGHVVPELVDADGQLPYGLRGDAEPHQLERAVQRLRLGRHRRHDHVLEVGAAAQAGEQVPGHLDQPPVELRVVEEDALDEGEHLLLVIRDPRQVPVPLRLVDRHGHTRVLQPAPQPLEGADLLSDVEGEEVGVAGQRQVHAGTPWMIRRTPGTNRNRSPVSA
jgi:hypothetical protein